MKTEAEMPIYSSFSENRLVPCILHHPDLQNPWFMGTPGKDGLQRKNDFFVLNLTLLPVLYKQAFVRSRPILIKTQTYDVKEYNMIKKILFAVAGILVLVSLAYAGSGACNFSSCGCKAFVNKHAGLCYCGHRDFNHAD